MAVIQIKEEAYNFFCRDITEDHPYAYEIVESISDDLLGILSCVPTSFIYGGMIRDIIASMALLGDIDVVSSQILTLSNHLNNSSRWILSTNTAHIKDQEDAYNNENSQNISIRLISYINMYGYELQLIDYSSRSLNMMRPKGSNIDRDDYNNIRVLKSVADSVDFRCCAVGMAPNGIVLELVDGAESDCLNKILTLNPECTQKLNVEKTKKRVNKLTKRGWSVGQDVLNFINNKG
jgi:hypothetical protein